MRGKGEGSVYADCKVKGPNHKAGSIRASDHRACGGTRYVAQLVVGKYPNGRLRYERRFTSTPTLAREALNDMRENAKAGVSNGRLTVSQYSDEWLSRLAASDVRPNTLAHYEKVMRLYVTPYIGDIKLTALRSKHVEGMIVSLKEAGRSPTTCKHARAALVRMLNKALADRLVMRNEAMIADGPRNGNSKAQTAYTVDEVRKLIDTASQHRLGVLAEIAVTTGMRQGELCALRWEDVDVNTGVIRVTGSMARVKGQGIVRQPPKTERSKRVVYVSPEALRRHRLIQQRERLAAGPLWRDTDLIFTTIRGNVLESNEVRRIMARWMKDAKLRHIRFHDLRHTAVTLSREAGNPLEYTSQMVGHSSTAMTERIYSHLREDVVKPHFEALRDLISGA